MRSVASVSLEGFAEGVRQWPMAIMAICMHLIRSVGRRFRHGYFRFDEKAQSNPKIYRYADYKVFRDFGILQWWLSEKQAKKSRTIFNRGMNK